MCAIDVDWMDAAAGTWRGSVRLGDVGFVATAILCLFNFQLGSRSVLSVLPEFLYLLLLALLLGQYRSMTRNKRYPNSLGSDDV